MTLEKLPYDFTVCKLAQTEEIRLDRAFCFAARTDEELSLMCRTEDAPEHTIAREDGWKGFRVEGVLDFSLVGVLSKLSGVLAESRIGIFAVSSYNTDYIFVKAENFDRALRTLADAGHIVKPFLPAGTE